MTKTNTPRQRFKSRGKHLVVSTRIALDPQQDASIIALLRNVERNGMASLIRTALRACYQAGLPPKKGSQPSNLCIELLEGDAGVILFDRNATSDDTAHQVVIHRADIQHVITELAIAQSSLLGRTVAIPEGVTLPLVTQRK